MSITFDDLEINDLLVLEYIKWLYFGGSYNFSLKYLIDQYFNCFKHLIVSNTSFIKHLQKCDFYGKFNSKD